MSRAPALSTRTPAALLLVFAIEGGLGANAGAPPEPAPPPPARPVFEARLDLVYVTVTVRDARRGTVTGLAPSDFELREDGQRREVEVFSHGTDERVPLDVAVLLDTSGSMSAELESAQRAALAVLQRIPRLRRRTVVSFDTDIRFWRADADPVALLPEVLAARPANGASAIRSAVAAGIEELTHESSGRGALILLSDGADVGSPLTETRLFRELESANVAIYPIPFTASDFVPVPSADLRRRPAPFSGTTTTPRAPDVLAAHDFLARLAEASGGRVLLPGRDLGAVLDGLVEELSSQYVVGFVPGPSPAGRSHRLDVRVARPHVEVRHRSRYRTR
jgi:VWFA-related protein